MDLDLTRMFCDVAQHRSISRAAEIHSITQSAASQRVQALEKGLGVMLIDRSTRPLSLTAAGEVYYRGCRRLLERFEILKQHAVSAGMGVENSNDPLMRGEVVVAAIYSAGIDLLNQVKVGFEREHPAARVAVSYHQPDTVFDHVRQERCDIGILSYPQSWTGIASIPLREEVMVVVARAGHRIAERSQIRAEDLGDYDLIGFDQTLPIGRQVRKYLSRYCEGARVINQFDNIDTIKMYLAQSDAVAILPRRTVQREVARGLLSATALEPTLKRPIGIVYLRHRRQEPVVKAFVEYLLKNQPSATELAPAEALKV